MTPDPDTAVRAREAWRRFGAWRRPRPFWGGLALLVSGLLTGCLPVAYRDLLFIATGPFTGSAILFGSVLVVCGLTVLTFPSMSTLVGGLGMVVSTAAILGALGGFVVGSLVGGIGGVLCFAWQPPAASTESPTERDARID
jgi:hypothetical protein